MVDKAVRDQLIEKLDQMPVSLQRRVLEFASTVGDRLPPGMPGSELAKFAGAISPEDCALMEKAIEEGCEQVDLNEW
ncbi:MAG TPA: hypothetical protein VGJ15_02880 [Pirellulales bacterium]|jgi:hypothetical protein